MYLIRQETTRGQNRKANNVARGEGKNKDCKYEYLPLIDVRSCSLWMLFLESDKYSADRGIYRVFGFLCLSCLPVIGGKASGELLKFRFVVESTFYIIVISHWMEK